ncbi:ankyrin repeat protein [Ectocarpus siliculosus]|uniref:Ankyrin repeat protein n=1 Tax=Ectocarpus siliculosus TaxID=2880 RepID=D7FZ26_ECTSI|nr:ankyrin repeat protein [Ectocarpus siliculosus]|eukprot:CBJ32643.1 ankyrin repeat protein [Ectocarpus siliculosus]
MNTEPLHVLGTWVEVPMTVVEGCRLAEEEAMNDSREIGEVIGSMASFEGELEAATTPLHNVVNANVAARLIMDGMKPTSRDGTGDHPLHLVEDPVVAVMFIAGGGNVNAKNGMGLKPLHMASNVSVASVLVANGAFLFPAQILDGVVSIGRGTIQLRGYCWHVVWTRMIEDMGLGTHL